MEPRVAIVNICIEKGIFVWERAKLNDIKPLLRMGSERKNLIFDSKKLWRNDLLIVLSKPLLKFLQTQPFSFISVNNVRYYN